MGSASVGLMKLQELNGSVQHEVEGHVMVQNGELPVDGQQMGALQSPVQVEDR